MKFPLLRKSCDPYLNLMRWEPLTRMYAIASPQVTLPVPPGFSAYGYDHYPGYDFSQWPDPLFLNPSLTPDPSKLDRTNLRKEVVERFCANCLPENYYLGNPMGVSVPFHGEVYGIVDGPDPRSGVGIGGVFLKVPGKLHGMRELLLIRERDPSRLSAENYHRTDILPGEHGQVFLVGQRDGPWGSISDREVWGVTTVNLENPYGLPVFMRVVIFGEIDMDPV